jgi:peroxiredoxin
MQRICIAFVLFLGITSLSPAQTLTWKPEKPVPGEKIHIQFNPQNSILAGVEKLEGLAIAYNQNIPPASFLQIDLNFVPSNGSFTAEFEIPEDANQLQIGFTNTIDGKKETNGGRGFGIPLYHQDRKRTAIGASVSQALTYCGVPCRLLGLGNNLDATLSACRLLFEKEPTLRKNARLLLNLAELAKQKNDTILIKDLYKQALAMQNEKEASDMQLYTALKLFDLFGKKDEASTLLVLAKKKYPLGQTIKLDLLRQFNKEKELDKKQALFNEWRNLPTSPSESADLNSMAAALANLYAKQQDWNNFEKHLNLMSNKERQASTLNSLAWAMLGKGIKQEIKAEEVERGTTLSKKSLDLLQTALKEAIENKPYNYPLKDYKSNLEGFYSMYSDTYAVGLYRQGNYTEAAKFQLLACEKYKYTDLEMNERYAIYVEKAEGSAKAELVLAQMIANGVATTEMKENFKRLYTASNGHEALAKKIIELEDLALAKKIEELQNARLNDEAPDFSLKNLNGEIVSLSSLRGKTVVLDFWATWCGPCLSSFPAMQKAQDAHQGQKDVVFLFIDTWESGANKEQQAAELMKSKGYTFKVLMDNDSKVIDAYKVTGIPTKFVIGPDGRIKFKSVGYSGNTESVLMEISQMIKLAGEVRP